MPVGERKKRLQQQFANFLDIPKEVILDLPKITMLGNVQVVIENHKGITEYTSMVVRVNTSMGEYSITGEGLSLRSILPEEIAIEGKIEAVSIKL